MSEAYEYEVRSKRTGEALLSAGFCLGYVMVGKSGKRWSTRAEAEAVRVLAGSRTHVVVKVKAKKR